MEFFGEFFGPYTEGLADMITLPYKSADGSIELDGCDWMTVPRTWRDVLRCRIGRHRKVMWGYTGFFRYVERCSCGALGDGRGWTCLDKQTGRRPSQKGSS